METSRRSILAAAGAGLTSLAAARVETADGSTAEHVAALLRLSEESNRALMRGDIDRYNALISIPDDFLLMSPFGGRPTRGVEYTPEKMAAMGRFFRNGMLDQELVEAYGSRDLVVLALIEHARVEVGSLPLQDWALRVTLVYRRAGSAWHLVHRHADPLVRGITLERAAELARPDR